MSFLAIIMSIKKTCELVGNMATNDKLQSTSPLISIYVSVPHYFKIMRLLALQQVESGEKGYSRQAPDERVHGLGARSQATIGWSVPAAAQRWIEQNTRPIMEVKPNPIHFVPVPRGHVVTWEIGPRWRNTNGHSGNGRHHNCFNFNRCSV